MLLESYGIVINVIKTLKNNSFVISILTEKDGIFKGYYKHMSKESAVVIGSLVHMRWYSRIDTNLGSIVLAQEKSIPIKLIQNYSRMCFFNSIVNIINYAIPLHCKNIKIYNELYTLVFADKPLDYPNWEIYYIAMEMYMLKILGFGLNFDKCYVTNKTKDVFYISPKTGNAVSQKTGEPFKLKLFHIPKIMKDLYFKNNIDYKISKNDLSNCYDILLFFIKKNIFNNYPQKIYAQRINIIEHISL